MKILGYALIAFGGWITFRLVQTKFGTDFRTDTSGATTYIGNTGSVSAGLVYTGIAAGSFWLGWKLVKRG